VAYSPAPAVLILIDSGGDLFKTTMRVQLTFYEQESQVTAVDFAVASENFDSLKIFVNYYSGIDLLQKWICVSRFRGARSFIRPPELGNTYARGVQMLRDVIIQSDTGMTPKGREMQRVCTELFFFALATENTVAAKILAETGAIDADGLDHDGNTALWYTPRLRDLELTEFILLQSSLPTIRLAFQPDENGNTLLHSVTMQHTRSANMYFANLLAICKSAPDLNIRNRFGNSPLAGALSYNNYTSAKALVLAGCKIDGNARLQRLKNLSVRGQLGIFDDTKLKEMGREDNIEWCRYDSIWDDLDLAGMSPSAIEEYLGSDDYEEQRQTFLNAAVQSTTPSERISSPNLSLPTKRRRQI
jgi:hypothetical protein